MLPTAYEFHWDPGHVIFLGVFYTVVLAVLSLLAVATFRGVRDLRRRRDPAIAWQEMFHDLPESRRTCRHAFDGPAGDRVCHHGFDCATCPGHVEFAAIPRRPARKRPAAVGLDLDPDRLYHRGHTWVRPEPDGTLTLGPDPFAQCCLGPLDRVKLPAAGQTVQAGERAVVVERGPLSARFALPVAGEVVEGSAGDRDWILRIRPDGDSTRLVNLLRSNEACVWMLEELAWLQGCLSRAGRRPTLADGGVLLDDLVAAYPTADWDDIWGQVCLEV